jgi:pimeloyl-ACP methyl ester carboxylesterase
VTRLTSFISFRLEDKHGDIRESPQICPQNGLTRTRHILMLIHGFNNTRDEAQKSYDVFIEHQERMGRLKERVVRVYWPGDTGLLKYYESIRKAKDTAGLLARELGLAARRRDGLVIDVVAHSMGCRLTLELLKQLAALEDPKPRIRRFVFMAAAVPIERLSQRIPVDPGSLREAFEASDVEGLSLHSQADWVLKRTFSMGQRKADEKQVDVSGDSPVALGLREWKTHDAIREPRLQQSEASTCGHGHYWPNRSGAVAPAVRDFLEPATVPRSVVERKPPQRSTFERQLAGGSRREFRSRHIGGR